YGVAVGRMFFAESMFSASSGGSKLALAALAGHLRSLGWPLFDAQVESRHLRSLGAEPWPRRRFLSEVARQTALPATPGPWTQAFRSVPAAALADGRFPRDFAPPPARGAEWRTFGPWHGALQQEPHGERRRHRIRRHGLRNTPEHHVPGEAGERPRNHCPHFGPDAQELHPDPHRRQG